MTKQEEDAWLAEVDLHKDDYKWLDRLHHRMSKRRGQLLQLIRMKQHQAVVRRGNPWWK